VTKSISHMFGCVDNVPIQIIQWSKNGRCRDLISRGSKSNVCGSISAILICFTINKTVFSCNAIPIIYLVCGFVGIYEKKSSRFSSADMGTNCTVHL
jgi:hypothetical protein